MIRTASQHLMVFFLIFSLGPLSSFAMERTCHDMLTVLAFVSTRDATLDDWFRRKLGSESLHTGRGSYKANRIASSLSKKMPRPYGEPTIQRGKRDGRVVLGAILGRMAQFYPGAQPVFLPSPLFMEHTLTWETEQHLYQDLTTFLRSLSLEEFEYLFLTYLECKKVSAFLEAHGIARELSAVAIHNSFEMILKEGFTSTSVRVLFPSVDWAEHWARLARLLEDRQIHRSLVENAFNQATVRSASNALRVPQLRALNEEIESEDGLDAVIQRLEEGGSLITGSFEELESHPDAEIEASAFADQAFFANIEQALPRGTRKIGLVERVFGRTFYTSWVGVNRSIRRLKILVASCLVGIPLIIYLDTQQTAQQKKEARQEWLLRLVTEEPSRYELLNLEPSDLGFEDENDPELLGLLRRDS